MCTLMYLDRLMHACVLHVQLGIQISGQSYKASLNVNYDSTFLITSKLLTFTIDS